MFLKEILGPKDRVFLVCFGNHVRLVTDNTNSAQEIIENYKLFDKGKKHFPELGPEEEDRELGTAFYDSIYYSVTEKLAQAGGRQAILMFSDGEDNSSSHNMMQAIETAQAANVVFYAIRYTEMHHGKMNARNKYGISVMDRAAKETGGAAHRRTGNGSSRVFPADRRRAADLLRDCLLPGEQKQRCEFPENRDQAETGQHQNPHKDRIFRPVVNNYVAPVFFSLAMQLGAHGHRVIGIDRAVAFLDVLDDSVFVDDDVRALCPFIGLVLLIIALQNSIGS